MFELVLEYFRPKTYKASDFKNIEGSKDVVKNLNKFYPKQEFNSKKLLKLEKLQHKDLVFIGSVILSVKRLESILLSFYTRNEIHYFYSYGNEHAKRLEFRYLMNKITR